MGFSYGTRTSISWTPTVGRRQGEVIRIKFSIKDCRFCPSRPLCCRSQKKYPRRTLSVRPQADYVALQAMRHRERTAEFAAVFVKRKTGQGDHRKTHHPTIAVLWPYSSACRRRLSLNR